MHIIVGLGNPGKKYANTRHNLGYITVEQLADRFGIKIEKSKFKSLVGEGNIAGQKVLLMKPETYMNNSGEAVRAAMEFYKIDPENLLIVYDDLDIPLGKIRIRSAGSAGTHNGMRSVIRLLGEDGFPRIRIGIGTDKNTGNLVDYVIGGFTKEEVAPLENACLEAVDAIICYLENGIEIAMNRYNKRISKVEEESDEE